MSDLDKSTPEYLSFYYKVLTAYDQYDNEELSYLRHQEPRWFEDIIDDLEREDGLR